MRSRICDGTAVTKGAHLRLYLRIMLYRTKSLALIEHCLATIYQRAHWRFDSFVARDRKFYRDPANRGGVYQVLTRGTPSRRLPRAARRTCIVGGFIYNRSRCPDDKSCVCILWFTNRGNWTKHVYRVYGWYGKNRGYRAGIIPV